MSNGGSSFPDALASTEEKMSLSYGLKYAKAIYAQWAGSDSENSLYGRRYKEFQIKIIINYQNIFEKCR